jgi:nucleotide-binding universal stress UspA family protein
VTVIELPLPIAPEFAMVANLAETRETQRREAELTVGRVREALAETGRSVEISIRAGKSGQEIVEEAKQWGADLILMGSHGRTGLKRVLLGSVAEYVVAHAPCSVEVVRGSDAGNPAAERGAAGEERAS